MEPGDLLKRWNGLSLRGSTAPVLSAGGQRGLRRQKAGGARELHGQEGRGQAGRWRRRRRKRKEVGRRDPWESERRGPSRGQW